MNPFEDLLTAMVGTPALPSARCRGKSHLFDGGYGLEDPRTKQAALLCRGCPSLEPCRAWADRQPPNALHGVVAGRHYVHVPLESKRPRPDGQDIPA